MVGNNTSDSNSPYAGLAKKIRSGQTASAVQYKSKKPKIRIIRIKNDPSFWSMIVLFFIGIIYSYQLLISQYKFSILINGVHYGDLGPGDTLSFELEPGMNKITVTTTLTSVYKFVELEMGDQIAYMCAPSISGICLTQTDWSHINSESDFT